MKQKRYGRRKANAPKRRMYKRAVRAVNNKIFSKRVEKALSKSVEVKRANYAISNQAITSVLSNNLDTTIKIINPTSATGGLYVIQQGTGQGNRVGNKITTRKCKLSGVIHINTTYDATTNYNMCPLYVAMYIVRVKGALTEGVTNLETYIQNSFFQAGNVSVGFSGTLMDLKREVNQNNITLLRRKIFKVGVNQVRSATAVGTANQANQDYTDGTVGIARMFSMDLTRVMNKSFTYNDGDNSPTNAPTYMFFVPLRVDGGLIQSSLGLYTGTIPCYVDYSIDYHYTDA